MSYFPLRVNTAGVIPPIFASSILMFPLHDRAVHRTRRAIQRLHRRLPRLRRAAATTSLYVALIVFFAYFYTAIVINPTDVAENIKKFGGYIPGIRPGKKTAEYIDRVLVRITLVGAIYMAAICVLPNPAP